MRLWRTSSDGAAILGASISAIAGLFALAFIGAFAIFVPLILIPPVTSVAEALLQISLATAGVYVASNALKLLSRRRPGYHDDGADPAFGPKMHQPALLAISLGAAAIVVGYAGWWHHRLDSREYAHSKTCFVQLKTADHVGGFDANFAPGYLEYDGGRYLSVAEEHGAMLGMRKEAVDRDLGRAAAAYFNSYSALTAAAAQRHRSALLNDIVRCLNDDWPAHGEILNP